MLNKVYLISQKRITENENNQPFGNFTIKDSVNLFHSLYENWQENFFACKRNFDVNILLNEFDRTLIKDEYVEKNKVEFFSCKNLLPVLMSKLEKYDIHNFPKMIFIFADTIGKTIKDLNDYLNALDNDDNNLLLVKDTNENICMFGLNFYNKNLLENLFHNELKADKFLKQYKEHDHFLYLYDGMLKITNLEDFRLLYKILSTKESIEFCSQEMHEKFTHLFIEYKELL